MITETPGHHGSAAGGGTIGSRVGMDRRTRLVSRGAKQVEIERREEHLGADHHRRQREDREADGVERARETRPQPVRENRPGWPRGPTPNTSPPDHEPAFEREPAGRAPANWWRTRPSVSSCVPRLASRLPTNMKWKSTNRPAMVSGPRTSASSRTRPDRQHQQPGHREEVRGAVEQQQAEVAPPVAERPELRLACAGVVRDRAPRRCASRRARRRSASPRRTPCPSCGGPSFSYASRRNARNPLCVSEMRVR